MSKVVKPPRSFIIRNKETGEVWSSRRGKRTWAAPGHAKNAWGCSHYYHWSNIEFHCEKLGVAPVKDRFGNLCFPSFNEQATWEIVEIGLEEKADLAAAKELLRLCLGRITDSHIEDKVIKFLEANNAE